MCVRVYRIQLHSICECHITNDVMRNQTNDVMRYKTNDVMRNKTNDVMRMFFPSDSSQGLRKT